MMTNDIIISLLGILLLLALGIYLLQGKGAMLIAGYNTLPKEEKEKYDEAALCKATGKLILSFIVPITLISLGDLLQINSLLIAGGILLAILIFFGLIYINTGNRYKKSGN